MAIPCILFSIIFFSLHLRANTNCRWPNSNWNLQIVTTDLSNQGRSLVITVSVTSWDFDPQYEVQFGTTLNEGRHRIFHLKI